LKHIELKKGKVAFFDKGYNDYKTFDKFTEHGVFFVTRLKSNAAFQSVKENDIPLSRQWLNQRLDYQCGYKRERGISKNH